MDDLFDSKDYISQVLNMNCNKCRGQVAPHKAIMLLAVIDLIEEGVIDASFFDLDDAWNRTSDFSCFERMDGYVFPFEIGYHYDFEAVRCHRSTKPFYKVAISATRNFYNKDYAIEKFREFLGKISEDYNIILETGSMTQSGPSSGAAVALDISKEFDLPIIVIPADWDKHGKSAAKIVNTQILSKVSYLIYFWNGNDSDPRYIVKDAEEKKIPCWTIDYSKEPAMCPECGGLMRICKGKRGQFLGCMLYPECNGVRPYRASL